MFDLIEKDFFKKIMIYFDGEFYEVYEGEKFLVVMLVNGVYWFMMSNEGRYCGVFIFGFVFVMVNGVKNINGRKFKFKDGMKIER